MCGIVAALPVYPETDQGGDSVDGGRLEALLDEALRVARSVDPTGADDISAALGALTGTLGEIEREVSSAEVGWLLVVDPQVRRRAVDAVAEIERKLHDVDSWLDAHAEVEAVAGDRLETVQAELRRALDLAWTLSQDRLAAAERVCALLAGPTGQQQTIPSRSAVIAYTAVDTVLEAIDRLEVRGRDSAGLHLWVTLDEADLAALPGSVRERDDPLFRSGAMVVLPHGVSIVYKTASVIGRLGDNVRHLRQEIAADADLRAVLALPSARVTVLAHTRWASVGRVSVANAHPLNSHRERGPSEAAPYVVAALNGDIDNHLSLSADEGLRLDDVEITTDAKLIPTMVSRRMRDGLDGPRALAESLAVYEGSMAIAVQADDDPDRLVLGVRGGGQSLHVGLNDTGYLVASEVFGLVSHTNRYVQVDSVLDTANDGGALVLTVHRSGGGRLDGVRWLPADGHGGRAGRAGQDGPAGLPESQVRLAEVSTRDLSRRGYERYLEKELAEASTSFRKTLRGRIQQRGRRLSAELPESSVPGAVRKALRDGLVREVVFLGQGTAAVAAAGCAHLLDSFVGNRLHVAAMPATEFSAWHLRADMSQTCLVVISQSGTTTDTNRAVDLARSRGASVLAIVNRRDSHLVGKADGVIYTSDGRDIEMAVASTKAFYAQVAAGMLLGLVVAKEVGALDEHTEDTHLHALREMPDHLEAVQRAKPRIAEIAREVACRYPHWAVVGSGPNRIAAAEVRIKASELCYRTMADDAVEDKKHIDLSAESLVLVCAAGAPATQLPDLVKEVEIFVAHGNQPVVITDAGNASRWPTGMVIEVPQTHVNLAWLLSTAAGHLFGYFAARAIDEAADPLRAALASLEGATGAGVTDAPAGGLREAAAFLDDFLDECAHGANRGVLGADTALRLATARWSLAGLVPGEVVRGLVPTTDSVPVDSIRQVLTDAIEELTRPVDSVKHQAKTVTVGTSRSGADLLDNVLVEALLALSVRPEALSHSSLLALHGLAQTVCEVTGATRYSVHGEGDSSHLQVLDKQGVAARLPSRADAGAPLSGTKKLVVDTRAVRLVRGRVDGRLVLMVPELSGRRVSGLSLLHVRLSERPTVPQLVAALEATGNRLAELRAAVTEHDRPFVLERLTTLPTEVVLLAPLDEVATAIEG